MCPLIDKNSGAVKYARNIWSDLSTYLSSGYIEISNNIAERAVKPFVINRKVVMTSESYDGDRYTRYSFQSSEQPESMT